MLLARSLSLLTSIILLCASACGGGGGGETSDGGAPESIDCNGMECDSATEYCVLTRAYAGDVAPGAFCLTKAESCSDCDCIDVEQDFLDAHDANNCSQALISCSSENGAITAECQRSSL